MPEGLRRFVESRNFSDLESALFWDPGLIAHPLVQSQIRHFVRLLNVPGQVVGELGLTQEYRRALPSEEQILERLEGVLAAFVQPLLPLGTVALRLRGSRPSGPKGTLRVRYPSLMSPSTIGGKEVHESFEKFRADLRCASVGAVFDKPHRTAQAMLRIIVDDAVGHVGPTWSHWQQQAQKFSSLLPADWFQVCLQRSGRSRVFDDEGAPAYVASAVLAEHLINVTPERVFDKVTNYLKGLRASSR